MFNPWGDCINWSSSLLFTTITANTILAIAYFSIPILLMYGVIKRRDLFNKEILVFAAFILACGLSHVVNILMIWTPMYWLSALLMVATCILATATALLLFRHLPSLKTFLTTSQLVERNQQLNQEMAEKNALEQSLRANEKHFRTLTENSPDIIARYDTSGKRIYLNPAYEKVTGIKVDMVIGKTPLEISAMQAPQQQIFHNAILDVVGTNEALNIEVSFLINGSSKLYHFHLIPEYDLNDAIESVLGIGKDVTESKHLEKQLQELATTDFLTGIHNKRSFINKLQEETLLINRYEKLNSVLLILDIDFFKGVNDTYGHHIGDIALKAVTQIMESIIRHTDIIGRIGGEEFAILLRNTVFEDSVHIAENLRKTVEETPINIDGVTLYLTLSIGLTALNPDDLDTSKPLIRADQALYRAKTAGRNRIEVTNENVSQLNLL